jgi:hypothetical protein
MSDATDNVPPKQPAPHGVAPAPDPADLGTAYGMELWIVAPMQAPAEEYDLNDPLAWIRRWVERHKTA